MLKAMMTVALLILTTPLADAAILKLVCNNRLCIGFEQCVDGKKEA